MYPKCYNYKCKRRGKYTEGYFSGDNDEFIIRHACRKHRGK